MLDLFPNLPAIVLLGGLALVACVVSRVRWHARSHGLPLPPGPKGVPFLGNISQMRADQVWKAYRDLCAAHGDRDMLHLTALGQHILVLCSPRPIFDILEKRSAIASDRTQSSLIPLAGQEGNMSLFPHNQWWRRHRRAFWQYFLPDAVPNYLPIQRKASHLFLRKILADPTQLCDHIRYTFAAAIVKVLYGVDVADDAEKYIALMDKTLEAGEAFSTGTYLVEFIPALRYVPEWVPGAGFQKTFAAWREAAHMIRDALPAKTLEGMADGSTAQSVVGKLLSRMSDKKGEALAEEMEIIKNVGFIGYEGGADTTFATLQTLFIAMYLYPEVQKKAQAELDAVVGPDRLPDHSDRAELPYVNAIVKEALRWRPVLPFAIPHTTSEDMEYEGYFIPSGTIILPNTWACLHDPQTYQDPESFCPERFLRPDGQLDPDVCDPARFAFGYGRRICPGRYFADESLFINIAMVLHVFDITPPIDEHGKAVMTEPKMQNRLVSYPEECRCTIKPRTEKAKKLILSDDSG